MKNSIKTLSVFWTLAIACAPLAYSDAQPQKPAPTFSATDASGKTHKLSDFAGKWVVLEWFNKDCPYVKKHYGSGNMQKLQKTYTDKGVIWLQVISSAKGKQGYLEGPAMLELAKSQKQNATATLLDAQGSIGKAYGAKTTPHMFVIDPKGVLVYAGAIDDNDSSNPEVIATSTNYVVEALDAGMSGKKVKTASTKAYGCSVKY